jgi:hypothetical protein
MTTDPEKDRKNLPPLPIRTFWFGFMLLAWWISTIELPWHNLSRIVTQRGVERMYHPLTIWVYGLSDSWGRHRITAVFIIVLAMGFHYFIWTRYPGYDAYGRWVFKAGFLVLYILLYGFFFLMFLGAELPIWMGI